MSEIKDTTIIENKINIISKFSDIFLFSQSDIILTDYRNLIDELCKLSSSSNFTSFKIDEEIIYKIFSIIEPPYSYCMVNDAISFFNINLFFKYKGIMRKKKVNLKKNEYKFLYKNIEYICFDMDSMKQYLNDLLTLHGYYIEITSPPFSNKKLRDIEQFLMLDSSNFKIMIDYQFKDIDYKNFDYDNIYKASDIITGSNLNLKLGHYVSLTEEDFNNFIYYDTEERKLFFKQFQQLLDFKLVFGFCGPYGTGKTVTMLKMIISNIGKKYLYINLETVNELHIFELKKLLRYEIIKLFDKKIIFSLNNDLEEKKAYDKIVDLIDKLEDKKIFRLLEDIILEINKLEYTDAIFIIDQYSSRYDEDNISIKNLININKKSHIIICSSMNNDSIKLYLYKCLNEKTIFPSYSINFVYYFYVGSLIRLNNLPNYEEIIKVESQEFVKHLNDFGNIPLYYYLLKRTKNETGEFDYFLESEKEKIVKEIKNFYNIDKNNKSKESFQMIIDILNIMSFINKKEIFFFDDLSEIVLKLPLKFLEIKKETMKINDLKLFGLASKNKKINDFILDAETGKDVHKIKDSQIILNNYVKFLNEDKYCSNYISKLTNEEKKDLGFIESKIDAETQVTIFYLDYLFPIMEEILARINYRIISQSSNNLFNQLPDQSKGGLLELIINEHVKNNKNCLLYYIICIETIENFVPNTFFIENYTTRKNNTLRTFIENKNYKAFKKRKLPNGNIFMIQLQFTGKYYDCALLVPNKKKTGYNLMLLQISKRKISAQRFFREEHMIILNQIKKKLENEYDIIITEGHFSYILLFEDNDKDTMDFCDKNNLNYFLFSIEQLSFKNLNIPIFNEKTLITTTFPIQSVFSILPKDNFIEYKNKLLKQQEIEDFQKLLICEDIEENLIILIRKLYVREDLANDDENEFYLFGHFDKMIKVNNSFCIWFDNKDCSLYYYEKNKYIKFIQKYSKKLSEKNFSLICSKYSIKKK